MSKSDQDPLLDSQHVSIKVTRNSSAPYKAGSTKFNWLFIKRFFLVLRVAVPSFCSKSFFLLVLLILARSAEEYNYYQVGILPSQFYTSLTGKNFESFKDILWKMVIIVISLCICKSGGEFIAGLVYVRWRAVITRFLHSHYFDHKVYYQLNIIDRKVDNPDQRITQDVDRFCDEVSQALPKLILQPFLIAYYSYRTFISLGWFGVLGIYIFFVIGTVINKFIMGPIVTYIYKKEKREGDFRFHHVQVRSNAESVALYQGGAVEGKKANEHLRLLLRAQLGSVHWQLPLNFAVFMFDYISSIISYSLVGIAIFSGHYDNLTPVQLASAVSKNTFFSMYLLNNFSTIVDTAVKFAEIAGYTHRIGQLLEVLRKLEKQRKEEEALEKKNNKEVTSCSDHDDDDDDSDEKNPVELKVAHSTINEKAGITCSLPPSCVDVAAVLQDVSISLPGNSFPLIEGLNLEFKKGRHVIILGETGTGKTSIFRVLRKLWTPLRGHAELCIGHSHHCAMFLPQKPHLTSGTLASQITFPEAPKMADSQDNSNAAEDKINECLAITGLISLRDKLSGLQVPVCENWYDIITPGEAQRIAFARLFFHMPPFAFLDEATSALSEECEELFYSKMVDIGITFMSIGHRSSLKKFHHQVLTIRADHSCYLQSN